MKNKLFIFILLLVFSSAPLLAQDDNIQTNIVVKDSVDMTAYTIDPLAPSKAAFYSAVLPGLGQVYNKKYWKVPIVYGAMGLSLY